VLLVPIVLMRDRVRVRQLRERIQAAPAQSDAA